MNRMSRLAVAISAMILSSSGANAQDNWIYGGCQTATCVQALHNVWDMQMTGTDPAEHFWNGVGDMILDRQGYPTGATINQEIVDSFNRQATYGSTSPYERYDAG